MRWPQFDFDTGEECDASGSQRVSLGRQHRPTSFENNCAQVKIEQPRLARGLQHANEGEETLKHREDRVTC